MQQIIWILEDKKKNNANMHQIKHQCYTHCERILADNMVENQEWNWQKYLFLEEVLAILQCSEPVLFVFMLQMFIRGVKIANQVLKAQTDWLNRQVDGGRLCFLAESIKAPTRRSQVSWVLEIDLFYHLSSLHIWKQHFFRCQNSIHILTAT